ncbi:MAG: NADH-quinone oxidoreductase subunit A [Coriobacteriia bacterium]|nr:NADH-quinone oxidoreductase subunit A [Coriobacteriia bacterium]
MQGAATHGVLFVLGLATAATGFILVVFLVNAVLSPRTPNPEKNTPFECGMEQAGEPWAPPRLRFSTLAMLFVLFDAEAILLFAVASGLKGSPIALLEIGTFVFFLAFGLVYAWRKGALEWRS